MQACWSFDGMQNLGFLMALDPVLQRTNPAPADYRRSVLRHLGYFNTHPYMAGFVLGVVAGMEERLADFPREERKVREAGIERLKTSLSASLGAIGDSFFWGALRPACAAWAVLVWIFLWTLNVPHPIFWGGVFYLAAFNVPALWVRWRGVRLGYELREGVVTRLKDYRWRQKAKFVRWAGLTALGLLTLAVLLVPPWGGSLTLTNVVVFAGALGLRAAKIPAAKSLAVAVVLGCVGALVGV